MNHGIRPSRVPDAEQLSKDVASVNDAARGFPFVLGVAARAVPQLQSSEAPSTFS